MEWNKCLPQIIQLYLLFIIEALSTMLTGTKMLITY